MTPHPPFSNTPILTFGKKSHQAKLENNLEAILVIVIGIDLGKRSTRLRFQGRCTALTCDGLRRRRACRLCFVRAAGRRISFLAGATRGLLSF